MEDRSWWADIHEPPQRSGFEIGDQPFERALGIGPFSPTLPVNHFERLLQILVQIPKILQTYRKSNQSVLDAVG